MAYPVDNSFDTEPDASYLTAIGGLTYSYNSAQQALDISAAGQGLLRLNEPSSENFWVEIDLEVLSDPGNRKHTGVWFTTGNGGEGYRFSHLDSIWSVSAWDSGLNNYYFVSPTINDGSVGPGGGLAPTFNVGDRRIIRVDVSSGLRNVPGGPFMHRAMTFSVSGAKLFTLEDRGYPGGLIPGIFGYGGIQLRAHSIKGGTPSATEQFPEFATNFSSPISLMGGRRNLHPQSLVPGKNISFQGIGRVQIRGAWQWDNGPAGGIIRGKVTVENVPAARQVRLYDKKTGLMVRETFSKPNGDYEFLNLDPRREYFVVSHDHLRTYNAVISDMIDPP